MSTTGHWPSPCTKHPHPSFPSRAVPKQSSHHTIGSVPTMDLPVPRSDATSQRQCTYSSCVAKENRACVSNTALLLATQGTQHCSAFETPRALPLLLRSHRPQGPLELPGAQKGRKRLPPSAYPWSVRLAVRTPTAHWVYDPVPSPIPEYPLPTLVAKPGHLRASRLPQACSAPARLAPCTALPAMAMS